LRRREELYARLFPHDNANFGLDPYWIHAYPYRQRALPGARVELEVRIMNHAAAPKQARAMLNLPAGWAPAVASGDASIPPHTEARIRLSAVAPHPASPGARHLRCGRRQAVGRIRRDHHRFSGLRRADGVQRTEPVAVPSSQNLNRIPPHAPNGAPGA